MMAHLFVMGLVMMAVGASLLYGPLMFPGQPVPELETWANGRCD